MSDTESAEDVPGDDVPMTLAMQEEYEKKCKELRTQMVEDKSAKTTRHAIKKAAKKKEKERKKTRDDSPPQQNKEKRRKVLESPSVQQPSQSNDPSVPRTTPNTPKTKDRSEPWVPGSKTDRVMQCYEVTAREPLTNKPTEFLCVVKVLRDGVWVPCGRKIAPKTNVGYSPLVNHVSGCHEETAKLVDIADSTVKTEGDDGRVVNGLTVGEIMATREMLQMMARTRMAFASLADDWWRNFIREKRLYVMELQSCGSTKKVLLNKDLF